MRPSSEDPDWGGPGAILNIGMNDGAARCDLAASHGETAATALYLRFVHAYADHVARLDPDVVRLPPTGSMPARSPRRFAPTRTRPTSPFRRTRRVQLAEVLRSMARAWEGTSARLLRQAKGAPADAGLGLVVQDMALGLGAGESGSGVIQFVERQRPACRRSPGAT